MNRFKPSGEANWFFRIRSSIHLWMMGAVVMGMLGSCGNPNVPLTQPPQDAFRVSSPRPPRVDRTPPPPTPTPPSFAALTAAFFKRPWPPVISLLDITATFFDSVSPKPSPSPSSDADPTATSSPEASPTTDPTSQPSPSLSPQPGSSPMTSPIPTSS